MGISPSIILSTKEILNEYEIENELAEPFSYLNLSELIGTAVEIEISENTALNLSTFFHHSINKLGNKVLFNRSDLRHIGLLTTVGVTYLFEKKEE